MATAAHHSSRQRSRARWTTAGVVVIILLAAGAVAWTTQRHRSATPSTTSTIAPTSTTLTTLPPVSPTTSPVGLSQTFVEPPSSPTALATRLAPLWTGIHSGATVRALPVFFPESVYVAMKTGLLSDPAGDFTSRLLGFFQLDLATYHAAVGPQGRFVTVVANPADATWIAPGACENLFGYWHLPGVRLVYRLRGVVRSFAVASLISWRGEWYVVHLGPNPRPTNVGTIDQPSLGVGTPGPAGGC